MKATGVLSQVVRLMVQDQGDLDVENEVADFVLPERDSGEEIIDWHLIEEFLGILSKEDLKKFALSPPEEWPSAVAAGGAVMERAHAALDEIFMEIGG